MTDLGHAVSAAGVAATPPDTPRLPNAGPAVLLAVVGGLCLAAALRLYYLHAGVPYAVGIDEPAIVDRALRMDRTGDLNPHFFDYPALVFYVQAAVGLVRYLAGVIGGEWRSTAQMDAASLYGAGRVVAAVIAVSGVYFTYRAGKELHGAWTGAVAAALLAVHPQQVRESHYILADVPAATFVSLALWMAFRAARAPTRWNFALAGVAAGLAAGCKYNGGFAIVAVVAVALAVSVGRDGLRAALVAMLAMAATFLLVNPYVILDVRGFLDGFGHLVGRFAHGRSLTEPAWLIYLKHLAHVNVAWLPVAGVGALVAMVFGPGRKLWAALLLFAVGYYVVIARHPPVYARYALPLLPALCLLVAFAIVRVSAMVAGRFRLVGAWLAVAATLWFVIGLGVGSVGWLRLAHHVDTREMAATWLRATAPRGSRVAVENFGPTNLDHAGFVVLQTGLLPENAPGWYAARCDYLVVTDWNPREYEALTALGTVVFQTKHAADQLGPDVQIVKVTR